MKRWFYQVRLFFVHFLVKFKKNSRHGFFAISKNLQIKSNLPIFNTNERFSRKRDFFSKKRPCYVFCIFCPQLHTKFRKNPRNGFWDMPFRTDGRTDEQTWIYRSSGFQPGTKKLPCYVSCPQLHIKFRKNTFFL